MISSKFRIGVSLRLVQPYNPFLISRRREALMHRDASYMILKGLGFFDAVNARRKLGP